MVLIDMILLFCIFSFTMYSLSTYLNERVNDNDFDATLISMSIVFLIEALNQFSILNAVKAEMPFTISGLNAALLLLVSIVAYEVFSMYKKSLETNELKV